MRRHTLDPNSIRKQIKSVFTSPTRKFLNFTNNNSNNGNSIIHFGRRTRRFSVPEKESSDRLDVNPELHTIQEVSQLISIEIFVFMSALLLYLHVANTAFY
jgi:hypothetical protein